MVSFALGDGPLVAVPVETSDRQPALAEATTSVAFLSQK